MKRATLSKALISLALTMALAFGAAALAAAPARNARAEDAFTAEWLVQAGADVTAAPAAQFTKEGGYAEAPRGLLMTVPAETKGYSFGINGIFGGNVRIDFNIPGQAGTDGGFRYYDADTVFEIYDVATAQTAFEVHFGASRGNDWNGWAGMAWLTYDYNGTEVYRSGQTRGSGEFIHAYGGWGSGLNAADNAVYYLPQPEQNGTTGENAESNCGYLILQYNAEGNLEVWARSNEGGHPARMAVFEDDPATYTPDSSTGWHSNCNLPKLNFAEGFGVRVRTEGSYSAGDQAVLLLGITESEKAELLVENKALTEKGVKTDLSLETLSAPAYFVAYAEKEGIAFDGAVPETAYAGGHAVQMPAAVYLDNGAVKEAALTVTDPFGEDVRVQDGVFATEGIGEYTATYTAGEKTYKYIVKAETIAMPAESALQAVNGSVSVQTGDYAGIHVDAVDENGISGDINGVFKGNAEVVFRLPSDLAEGDAARWRDVDFIVKDLEGKEAFRVEFSSGDGYATLPTLYYEDQIRAGVRNSRTLAEAKWTPMIWFKGREYAGADYGTAAPSFNAKDNTKAGYISLEWEGEVLNVWYLASGDIKMKLASFDGIDTTSVPESGYQRYESEEDLNQNGDFALPKIYDRLKDGYTISFAASASELVETLNVVSVNGVSLAAEALPVQNTTYAVEEDLSVRQNGKLSAEITYTMHFAEGWTMPTVNIVQVDVDTSVLGETTGVVSDPMAAMFGLEVNNVEVPVLVREPQAAELFADMKGKLTMEEGAAIRLDEPTGLRFTARVNKAAADALSAAYGGEVSYGTLIVPQDMLEVYLAEELFNSEGVLKVASSGFYGTEGEDYIFRASIVNIKGYNYTRAFVGIAYVETADGVIFAADYEGTARSVYEVAKALYADRQDTADDDYQYEIDGMYSPYTAQELAAVKTLYIDAVAEIDDKGYVGNAMYYTAPYSVETAESDGVKKVTVTSSEVIKTVIYNGERIPSTELSFGADGKSVTFKAAL